MIAALAGIFVTSIQRTHCYHPSGPQQGLKERGILLWAVHLASQGGITGNKHDLYFSTSQVTSSISLTFHCHAH